MHSACAFMTEETIGKSARDMMKALSRSDQASIAIEGKRESGGGNFRAETLKRETRRRFALTTAEGGVRCAQVIPGFRWIP